MAATISLRVHFPTWSDPTRCDELLALLQTFRDTLDEVAFFTSQTHPPLPLDEIRRRAARLTPILGRVRSLGIDAGINHLATIGHLDENREGSLSESWQRLADKSGRCSASCYCASDPAVAAYITECYHALAQEL